MNPLLRRTSRKALHTATLTMVVGAALVLLYWTLAMHGVVPSPNRPLMTGLPATSNVSNQVTFHAAAEPTPKPSAPQRPPEGAAPAVRVSYVRSDIIELLRAGRGVLVASSGNEAEKKRREFVLTSSPSANPEYVAFTPNHSARFAKFGIALRREGEVARLAGPLPAYFGGTAEVVTLEFVPDQVLGRAIYTQVSRAIRAANSPVDQQNGWVYEGELRVEAGQPEFTIQRVRTGSRDYVFGSKEAGAVN